MTPLKLLPLLVALSLAPAALWAKDKDAAVKKEIVRQSQLSYTGNCPCPENRDRAGRRCGRRSAYSRAGGASPLCYISDVTPQMIQEYKARNALAH